MSLVAALSLASCATERSTAPVADQQVARTSLKLASWNLEFLAEKNGSGCHPRDDADYARMKRAINDLDADVIAFAEVESPAAAARVFDPERYIIVMEARPGKPGGMCGPGSSQTFIRQAVGFAIRQGISFTRNPDITDLQIGNPNLRSGADVTIKPAQGEPLRLLAVHLKSGCFQGTLGSACSQLLQQMPVLARWIDTAAAGKTRFAVLGDWNRRLALKDDIFWATIDDKVPFNDDLTLTDRGALPSCDPRFHDFIDHIVLDKRAGQQFARFSEIVPPSGQNSSDHCPLVVELRR